MKIACFLAIYIFSLVTIYAIPNKGNSVSLEELVEDFLEDVDIPQNDAKHNKVSGIQKDGVVKRSTKHATELTAGNYLSSGEFIVSNNYNNGGDDSNRVPFYSACMQDDGNFVVYLEHDLTQTNRVQLWSTGTSGQSISVGLRFQSTGLLLLVKTSGGLAWQSYSSGGASLKMQDDGRLVIYSSSGDFVWSAGYLLPGTVLPIGESLFNGQYTALMKSNGNFILYDTDGTKLCGTNTAGNAGNLLEGLRLKTNGNLVILDSNGNALWKSYSANGASIDGDRLVLTSTPTLQIYHSGVLHKESSCNNGQGLSFR